MNNSISVCKVLLDWLDEFINLWMHENFPLVTLTCSFNLHDIYVGFFNFGEILRLERNTAKPRYLKVCLTGNKKLRYTIVFNYSRYQR